MPKIMLAKIALKVNSGTCCSGGMYGWNVGSEEGSVTSVAIVRTPPTVFEARWLKKRDIGCWHALGWRVVREAPLRAFVYGETCCREITIPHSCSQPGADLLADALAIDISPGEFGHHGFHGFAHVLGSRAARLGQSDHHRGLR